MEPQTDRITQIEENVMKLYRAGRATAEAGLTVSQLGAALERKVALNTATIESFERTIADMQAQIDELKAGRASDVASVV